MKLLEGMEQATAEQRALATLRTTAIARTVVMVLATANAIVERQQVQVHQGPELHGLGLPHGAVVTAPAQHLALRGTLSTSQDRESRRIHQRYSSRAVRAHTDASKAAMRAACAAFSSVALGA